MRPWFLLGAVALVACGSQATPGASSKAGSVAPVPHAAPAAPGKSSGGAGHSSSGGGGGGGGGGTAATCSWPISGGQAGAETMSGITAESDDGYDRLVVQFSGAIASYRLAVNPGGVHFTSNGQSLSLGGSVGLVLDLSNVTVPKQLADNSDLQLQSAVIQEVQLLGATGSTATVALGLNKMECPRISTLASPSRLVIDFPT